MLFVVSHMFGNRISACCCFVCRVVALLQQYITLTLYQQQAITPGIEAATRLLGLLEKASSQQQLLDMAEFYNDAVNEPDFNIKEDYKRWNAVRTRVLHYSCMQAAFLMAFVEAHTCAVTNKCDVARLTVMARLQKN